MSTVDDDGYATVDALTTDQREEEDYTFPSGVRVRIRALSRLEVLRAQKLRDAGLDVMEAHMIRCAIIRPVLRDADVRAWMEATPAGELEPLTRRINTLSGLDIGADTAAYERFRDGSNGRVGSLPGAETEHDGGAAAGQDVSPGVD